METVKVPKKWKERAYVDKNEYEKLYKKSVEKPDKFWGKEGKRIDWIKPYTIVKNTSFAYPYVSIKWFEDGTLNVAYNCIDRHLEKRGDQTAILWEGDDPKDDRAITYRELHAEVCRMANVLRLRNVKKGDRVTIYMPMIPETAVAMLACARIGAIHSVVFGGFAAASLAARIDDAQPKVMVTSDAGMRMGKVIPLKPLVDESIRLSKSPPAHVVIADRGRAGIEIDGPGHRAHGLGHVQ